MEKVEVGNIYIYIENHFLEQVKELVSEFRNNIILNKIKHYTIYVYNLSENKPTVENDMIRISLSPLDGSQRWKDDDTDIIITNDYISYEKNNEARLYCDDLCNIYGFLRTKISEVIRQALLINSICGLHAGFFFDEKENFIVIGNKGNGKTSSVINAYCNKWSVCTDETVFIKDDFELEFLFRLPSLSIETIDKYFYNKDLKVKQLFTSQLTRENKMIIDIPLQYKKINIYEVKRIFILASTDTHINITSNTIKNKIISKNWIDGNVHCGFESVIEQILEKSEIINIEGLKKFVGGDH